MAWTPPAPVVAGALPVGTASYAVPGNALFVSPSGDDSATGVVFPKRTLGAAIAAAPSGASSIVLRAGEYHEEVTTPTTKILTIQAYPGEAVWFDGSRVYPTWSGTGPWAAPTVNWNPINAANYPQVGDGLAHLPEQVWIDDVPQVQVADGVTPGAGQFSVNRSTDILTIGSNPVGKVVRVAEKRVWMVETGRTHLRGFGVRRYSPSAVEGVASSMVYIAGSAHDSTMENMVFRESGMHALSIIRPITLNRITVEECNNAGIQVTTANNTVISRFLIQDCNLGGWSPQPITAGIKITRTDGLVIRDGIVRNVPECCGVWFDVSNTRFVVANVLASNVATGFEAELSGGGEYSGVQHHSWFVNCHTTDIDDWSMQVLDSDYVTVANCGLVGGRVAINCQQDRPGNTGTPGNLTFEIVPWVSVHNRLWNNKITTQPTIASIISYHDPAEPVRDPDGGPDRILLGWDLFDHIAGNWVPTAGTGLGSMIQLGKVDGFRNSYNTWSLANNSPAAVGGPPGGKLGINHQGASTPADTIAVPLPDDIADLLGVPRGHQQVGPILSAPVLALEEEETMNREWPVDVLPSGTTLTTSNVLSDDGAAASIVGAGSGGTIQSSDVQVQNGSTSARFVGGGVSAQVIRLPFAAASATAAARWYHRDSVLSAVDLANVRHASGQLFRVGLSGSGSIQIKDATGGVLGSTATGAWAVDRFNRIEVKFDNSGGTSSGVVDVEVFDGEGLTPTGTLSLTGVNLGSAQAVSIDFGAPNAPSFTHTYWLDSIGMADGATAFLGPYLTTVTGTLAATLPVVTAAIAGTVVVTGTLNATLPSVTSSISGAVSVPGTLAASVPGVTASVSGQVAVSGSISASLPLVTSSMTGVVSIPGTLAAVLPLVTSSISGTVDAGPTATPNPPWTLVVETSAERTLSLGLILDRDLTLTTPIDLDVVVTAPNRTLELGI